MSSYDLNFDGKKEIIVDGVEGIYIIDHNLKIKAFAKNLENSQIVKRGKERPYLVANTKGLNGCVVLSYEINKGFIFYKLRRSIFLISLLVLLSAFFLIYRIVLQFINLAPFSRQDNSWIEIDRKYHIYQMSHDFKKLFDIPLFNLTQKLEYVFSTENAKNMKQAFEGYKTGTPIKIINIKLPNQQNKRMYIDILPLPSIFKTSRWIITLNETETDLSDRLANWVTIVRALIHNLKNPLTTALMQISRLKKEQSTSEFNSEKNLRKLDEVKEEILRSKTETSKSLSFIDDSVDLFDFLKLDHNILT